MRISQLRRFTTENGTHGAAASGVLRADAVDILQLGNFFAMILSRL